PVERQVEYPRFPGLILIAKPRDTTGAALRRLEKIVHQLRSPGIRESDHGRALGSNHPVEFALGRKPVILLRAEAVLRSGHAWSLTPAPQSAQRRPITVRNVRTRGRGRRQDFLDHEPEGVARTREDISR